MKTRAHMSAGSVVVLVVAGVLAILLLANGFLGWERAWQLFAVPAMQPPFRDMHAVTDHAECFAKGFNAYFPNPCDPQRVPFNYPPPWLWLGYLGIKSGDAPWLALLVSFAAFAVVTALLSGRSAGAGALASLAIISPSVLLGVERGNVDLLILALVGGAALLIGRSTPPRLMLGTMLLWLATILKLYPIFCVAFAVKRTRVAILISIAVALTAIYFLAIYDTLLLINRNTPRIAFHSYGYRVPFVALDGLLQQAGQAPTGLAVTVVPVILFGLILFCAGLLGAFWHHLHTVPIVADDAAGVAFLFGAGIFVGTFGLGANFVYRLCFLLLCLPQILDWRDDPERRPVAVALLVGIFSALWLNGYPLPLVIPQLFDWALLLGLAAILVATFRGSKAG
jgi:hypothetical protein